MKFTKEQINDLALKIARLTRPKDWVRVKYLIEVMLTRFLDEASGH